MATYEKRASGWRARIRRQGIGTIDRHFKTKSEARQWAKRIEAKYENREIQTALPSTINLTLNAALKRYRKEVTPLKRGAIQERRRIDAWLKEPLARERLLDISGRHFAVYRDRRIREGKSPSTVRLELALISHVFTVARREWGLEFITNPVRNIRMPPLPQGRDRRFVGDEEQRLLIGARQCGSPWLAPIIEIAVETAMRQGEILAIRWDDTDLDRRVTRLRHTKNGDGRMVPLSTRAIDVLQALEPKIAGLIFPYKANAVRLAFTRLRSSLDIEDLRFHDLRHEATSRLFEKGLNQMEVAAITGHKTLQMLKRYTHLRAEDLAKKLG